MPLIAQENQYDINGWSISIVPSAIVNVWEGYQVKLDYGFKNDFGTSLNIGYLHGNHSDATYRGLRLRKSFRYYFRGPNNPGDRSFIGIGYLHRRTTSKAQGDAIKFDGQFFERVRYTRKNSLNGAFLMIGGKVKLNDQFLLETFLGLGLGVINRTDDLPEDVRITRSETFTGIRSNIPGKANYGIIIAHFSIGMRL